jgi:hypothetical protein
MLGVETTPDWRPSGDGCEIDLPEEARRNPPSRRAVALSFPLK